MMYNQAVTQAFTFSAADSQRYGVANAGNSFGNACLVAKQILAADQGTRFIQISLGGWDMHSDIYGLANPNGTNMFTLGPQLDGGLAALIDDLKAAGLFDSTLIVMVGEFGRTPGPVTAAGGRDHFLLLSAMLAGGGIKGGKVIGATNADNSAVTDYGWDPTNGNPLASANQRYVRPEDLESTIYSAMGIDWTTIRYDDPFKRGFEYVPFASVGTVQPRARFVDVKSFLLHGDSNARGAFGLPHRYDHAQDSGGHVPRGNPNVDLKQSRIARDFARTEHLGGIGSNPHGDGQRGDPFSGSVQRNPGPARDRMVGRVHGSILIDCGGLS